MTDLSRRPAAPAPYAVAALVFGVAVSLCAAAPPVAAQSVATATVDEIRLVDSDGGQELRIRAGAPFALVGVQVDPDDSIVVQLPGLRPSSSVRDLFPATGLVAAVRCAFEESPRGPMTRIVITSRRPLSHSFEPRETLLSVRLWPRGEDEPQNAPDSTARSEAEAVADLDRARLANQALRSRLSELEAEKAALGDRLAELERRRVETSAALESTLTQIQQLDRERERERELEAELAEAEAQIARLAEQSSDRRSEGEAQAEAWQAEVDRAVEARKKATEELERISGERDQVARELAEERSQSRQLLTEGFDRGRIASRANLRREPTTEGEVVRVLEAQTPVVVSEGAEGWYRVRFDDVEGWVWGELLKVESEEIAQLTAEVERLAQVERELETRLDARDDARRRLEEVEQERARLASELEAGRADLEQLKLSGLERAVTLSAVNLRGGPSTDDEALELLPEGTTLAVLGRQGEWYSVRAGGGPGWVFGDLVRLESNQVAELKQRLQAAETARDLSDAERTEASTEAERARQRALTLEASSRDLEKSLAEARREVERLRRDGFELGQVVDAANLRSGPGTDQPRLTLLAPATTVEILEMTDEWVRVRAGASEGWIWSELLTPASRRVAELEAELERARAEAATSAESLERDAEERSRAGERAAELEAEKDRLTTELAVARRQSSDLEGRLEGAERDRRQAEERAAELATRSERDRAQLTRVESERDAYRRTANSVESGARNLDESLARTRSRLEETEERNRALEQRLAELEAAAEEPAPTPPQPVGPDAPSSPSASPPATPAPEGTPARTTVRTFLRSGPDTDRPAIALISEGTDLEILGCEQEWCRVRVGGTQGWMYGPLLEPAAP